MLEAKCIRRLCRAWRGGARLRRLQHPAAASRPPAAGNPFRGAGNLSKNKFLALGLYHDFVFLQLFFEFFFGLGRQGVAEKAAGLNAIKWPQRGARRRQAMARQAKGLFTRAQV
jgi:hypothetical protein